jgi:pimeloyl-ACP methyl ester carboxylesterase
VSARARFFANAPLGRILAEFVVVPLGLALIGPSVRSIFAPAPVARAYSRTIGAALAIRPASFIATCRDIADLYGHLVRLSARYPEIRCPTEIVTGDWDRVVSPFIHAFGLARDIPGARLTVLPGAGHMPHWSRPDEVAAAVERVAAAAAGLELDAPARIRSTG